MSLINDALKKAARQRAEEQADLVAPMPGGGSRRPSRQGAPMRTQTMVLIGAAALALIVVSAVITGMMMNAKPEAKAPAADKPAPSPVPQPQAPAAKIVIQAPVMAASVPKPAAPVPTAVPTPTAAPSPTPTPAPIVQAAPPAAPSSPAPSVASSPAPAAASPQGHTDMVQGIVDAFHISGVRLAGTGSKALVDGHVYKLNDIVDKSLGLRLVKVDEDRLTFADKEGNTYVRTF
jgi:outer membrane biosynthesis protein TonB